MEDENEFVIQGKFIEVHFPSFELCQRDALHFTLFSNKGIYTPMPSPLICFSELTPKIPIPDIPESGTADLLLISLQQGLENLSFISPLSSTRKPLKKPTREFISQTEPMQFYEYNPELENDPSFQKLKYDLEKTYSIFD